MNTSIEQHAKIVEYNPTAAALSELKSRLRDVVYDVTAKEGMQVAVKDRAEVRGYRVNLEKLRKEIKSPALERCQLIDSEARSITAQLEALENPIDEQIKKEERRKEEIKLAIERAEAERIKAIEDARIAAIAETERLQREAEQAKLAAERAEVEKMRAEAQRIIAAQYEANRKHELEAAAARRTIEDEARAARLKIENEQRAARLEIEKLQHEIERQAKVKRDADEAAAKIERDKIEAEKLQIENARRKEAEAAELKAKAKREKEEEKQREIKRREMCLLDGRELLTVFLKSHGEISEFGHVIFAINEYFDNFPTVEAAKAAT